MNTKRLVIITTVLTLTLAFAAMASAYGNRGFAQAYDQLAPEKQEAVRSIFEKHHDKLTDLKNAIWAKQTELDALTSSGNATKADIKSLVGEISDLRIKMQKDRDAMFSEVEAETGLSFGGRGMGYGYGSGDCPRNGSGRGNGGGNGRGNGGCEYSGGCNRF